MKSGVIYYSSRTNGLGLHEVVSYQYLSDVSANKDIIEPSIMRLKKYIESAF